MKRALLAALLLVGAAGLCRAENAASMASNDPLTKEILRKCATANCGVTGIRVDSTGRVVQIQAVELSGQPISGGNARAYSSAGALEGLHVEKGLLPKAGPRTVKGKTIEQPQAQLDHVETRKKW